jgi:hypothetical protein
MAINRHRRVVSGLAAAALTTSLTLAGAGLAPASAAPAGSGATSGPVLNDSAAKVTAPVTGTTEDGRQVRGTFTPEQFQVVDDTLQVTGTLAGRIVGKGGAQTFSEPVTMTVESINGQSLDSTESATQALAAAQAGSCDILNLVLGPLDLDLLGLQVSLDQVVLDIVAKAGAGNLLGNLLCSVAGLLDDGLGLSALLDQLVGILNDLLGNLGLAA